MLQWFEKFEENLYLCTWLLHTTLHHTIKQNLIILTSWWGWWFDPVVCQLAEVRLWWVDHCVTGVMITRHVWQCWRCWAHWSTPEHPLVLCPSVWVCVTSVTSAPAHNHQHQHQHQQQRWALQCWWATCPGLTLIITSYRCRSARVRTLSQEGHHHVVPASDQTHPTLTSPEPSHTHTGHSCCKISFHI